jgi:phosphotriesterase-related protein
VATTIAGLIQEGFGDRVLISHDAGVRTRLTSYGSWGYAHILRHVVPLLRERGLDESDIDLLLVRNPGAVLTVEAH